MSYKHRNLEERITAALKNCAASFLQRAHGQWELSLANGKEMTVNARLVDEWLLFDTPVSDRIARKDLVCALQVNSTLPGLCKLVMTPQRSVHLRADLPLIEEDAGIDMHDRTDGNLATSLKDMCSNLKEAYGIFHGEVVRPESAPANGQHEDSVEELRRTCVELCWPFIERSAGKFVFELEVRDSFHQAVMQQANAGFRLSVEASGFDVVAPVSRQALSALMLITGAQVRLARPSAHEGKTGCFEVLFATLPNVSELNHALSSLSVACSLCAREALVLRDERVAVQYLAHAGLLESPANLSLPAVNNAVV